MTWEWLWVLLCGMTFFQCVACTEETDSASVKLRPQIVIGQATLLAWPFLQLAMPDEMYTGAVALSTGSFISSLLPPSAIEPGTDDLEHLPIFVIKWAAGWINQFVFMLIIGLIIWLLSFMPWLKACFDFLSVHMPPELQGDNSWIAHVIERASPIMIVLGSAIIFLKIGGDKSLWLAFVFCISAFLLSLNFRWLLEHREVARHLSISGVVGGVLAVDFFTTVTKLKIKLGRGFEPPF